MSGIVRRNAGFTLFLWIVLVFLLIHRERAGVPAPVFYVAEPDSALPLYGWLTGIMADIPWFAVTGLTFLLAFIVGFVLMRTMVRNMVIQQRSYMPVLVFLVAAFGTSSGAFSLIGVVTALLLVLSVDTMLDSFRRDIQLGKVFNSALLAGMAVLIYPGAVVYFPVLLIAMVVFRKTWRDLVVCVTGFVLPLLMCSYVLWAVGGEITGTVETIVSEITARFYGGLMPAVADPFLIALWGTTLLLTVVSIVDFLRGFSTTRTRPYKTFLFFLWILLFSSLLFVAPGRSSMDLFLMAVPLSVVISTYLLRNNSLFATILFFVFILSAVVNIIAPLLLS